MVKRWVTWLVLPSILVLLLSTQGEAVGLKEGIEELVAALGKGVSPGKTFRVAVTDFQDLQGATSDLGRYIAERLTTRLSQSPNFSVIERRRLGQVLGELKFSMSDLVDPAKAKQVGQVVGVEAIVVGTYSDLGQNVDLDARMIEIATARTLPGASVTISKDPVVAQLMERGREVATYSPSPGVSPAPAAVRAVPTKGLITFKDKFFEHKEFRLDLVQISTVGENEVALVFTVVNKADDPGYFQFSSAKETNLLDAMGKEHSLTKGTHIGTRGQTLVPKLKYRFSLTFARPPASASPVNFVASIAAGNAWRAVTIVDIPIPQ